MELSREHLKEIFGRSFDWVLKENYSSADVCDVTSLPVYLKLQGINANYSFGKYLYAPFYYLYKSKPESIRKLAGIKPRQYPQAFALMISGLCRYADTSKDPEKEETLKHMLVALESSNSADAGYYAWGQPYNWFSRKVVPANTPRTTVTTQAGHAFLDAYEYFKEERYLEIARKTGDFLLEKMPYDTDSDGDVCFPYTTIDSYHVHNANVLGAAFLVRLGSISKNEKYYEIALKSFRFTAKLQNENGSWYYWAPPDKIIGKIDHYHTGFVLESFKLGQRHWKGDFPFEEEMKNGLRYYMENMFEDATIPKMFPDKTFPVDIQSCAQALITIGEMKDDIPDSEKWMLRILDWTLKNLYDEKNSYFYYRLNKGSLDRTPYLRWGQSWMIRALSYLLDE